jgi:CheY-like chemotaxis protein
MTSPLLEQRRHHLDVRVPAKGLVVDADVLRLTQVVTNLLTNAAKFTQAEGHVSVSAEKNGKRVSLRVVDDGIGIAPEMLPRVFDAFAQEQQTLDRAHGGLGLGLTVVANLVKIHGGTVAASSSGRGKGATFTIDLPLSDTPAIAAPGAAAVKHRQPSGLRVLVVDDNQDAAAMLSEALELLGCETRTAHDGTEALRVAAEFEPRLALLDIGLPVMDGYELARRLRASGGARMHLVAITGYGQESDRLLSAEAGFDAHVVKPVALPAVEALIERYRDEAEAPALR